MNLALFLMVLVVSFIVVRIGAIAFQLTGLEWSAAKFQALSCFTSTGFTTKEAELITGHPQRRRIASALIVFGHAGFVTMIATLVNSLRAQEALAQSLSTPILPFRLPPFMVQVVNIVVLLLAVWLIYKVFTNTTVAKKLTDVIKSRMIKREIFKPISCEELLLATGGYGVANVRIRDGHPIADKAIAESGLKKDDIIVLAIARGHETIPNPPADARILAGDSLICFGKLDNIRKEFA